MARQSSHRIRTGALGWPGLPLAVAAMGLSLSLAACRSPRPAGSTASASAGPAARSSASAPVPGAPVSAGAVPDDSVPAIAQREVIRRQERIRQMDAAALKASQALAEEDLEGAVSGFRRAVDGL